MLKKYSISLIVAFVFITPISVFALVNWMEKKWRALPVYIHESHQINNVSLTNQNGQTISLAQGKGNIVVAAFFFTHCPVICPKMVENLKKVDAACKDQIPVLINAFSVDPANDSVQQLKRFADRFSLSANWNLLTGDKATIYQLARKSFAVTAEDGDGGEHDFIHSDKLVLIDTDQQIRGYYSGTSDKEVQQLILDIKKLHNEK